MTETLRQRARRVFMEVADLPPEARDAALDVACTDEHQLRAEVKALLDAEAHAGAFMANPTADRPGETHAAGCGDAATLVATQHERPGTRIGPYKLLQLIGEGGFGSVFMAEQEKPVSRKVALKIIKLGMDTRAVIARFEAERQALAMMDHPNIARVLDAGATETGRPFFVMELVKGDAIVEYCDKNNLSIPERLELFTQVCQAVQHAHTKGIIHRDIKPSNILVSTQDGRPHAKVIDFGIAKATASRLTEMTLFTEHKQLIGTPQYMSPEQAEGSLDIDTRTDVYSLGVLLYELLTGTTPFDPRSLRAAAYAEIQRIIREVEPPKPSTRLSSNMETIANVAARRHTEPKKLGTIVRGDLDWIVMKALEKDRQRRYETANGLAMDVHRHLAGEAVLAAPPSAAYRMRKFIRRHRAQVAAAALIAVALLLGMTGTAWQAKVASDQAAAAKMAEDAAKVARNAERARADELKQVSDFQEKMLSQIDPTTAGVRLTEDVHRRLVAAMEKAKVPEAERIQIADEFRRAWARVNATDAATALIDETVLRPAVEAVEKQFKEQPLVSAQLQQALAQLYVHFGLYEAALPLQESSLSTRRLLLGEEHPDTLNSVSSMGFLLRVKGDYAGAEPLLRTAMEISRRVRGNDDPNTLAAIGNYGLLLDEQGKFADSEMYTREAVEGLRRVLGEDHPRTLAAMDNLSGLFASMGRLADAENYRREVLETSRRALGEDDPGTLNAINGMGFILRAQGRLKEVEPYFLEALQRRRRVLGEEHPRTIESINNMGDLLRSTGRVEEAEPYYREALEKGRRVLGEEHPSTLTMMNNIGALLYSQGKPAEAEPYVREAMEKRQRLLGPDDLLVLDSKISLGNLLSYLGRPVEAERHLRDALQGFQRVRGDGHPQTLGAMYSLSSFLRSQGRPAEAEPFLRELLESHRLELGDAHPSTLIHLNGLGMALQASGKLGDAEAVFVDGLGACERAFPSPHPLTAMLLHHYADVLRALGRHDEALHRAQRAHEMYLAHPDWAPEEAVHATTVLTSILTAMGRFDESLELQRASFVGRSRLLPRGSPELASQLAAFGLELLKRGTLEAAREAEPLLRECVEIRLKALPESWLVPNSKSLLGGAILITAEFGSELDLDSRAARFREAEVLLLDGYAGLVNNPAVPTPAQAGGDRRREALERIIHLYEVWDRIEPGNGHDAKASDWKAMLERAN